MNSRFYAYLSRMKLIRRWSLMRNVQPENIQEHSHQVAVLAHALCEIDNVYFGGNCDTGRAVLLALYHDVGEVIVGDLPTPVKYFNPEIKCAYGGIEDVAREKLLSLLPAELKTRYRPFFRMSKAVKRGWSRRQISWLPISSAWKRSVPAIRNFPRRNAVSVRSWIVFPTCRRSAGSWSTA